MFQLKSYQQRCLDDLSAYFRRIMALRAASGTPEKDAFNEIEGRAPYQEVKGLPGLPYVCIRVPTGGGKTVMASHAVGRACKEYLCAERCLVFWLAPTTQIVSQTIDALNNRRHPYRQALDSAFGGAVSIMDLPAALRSLKPGVLAGDTVVIVSTIQAPRVGDPEGRKLYDEYNGHLMDHFENLKAAQLAILDRTESGKPAISLANVFKLHRPLIIVDEAHNARTALSFETLARFNPSCIIEFTATPAPDSNVLVSVSAAELKHDEMIKLPVRLHNRPQWVEAVRDAVGMQAELEKTALEEEKATGEHIRPVVLLQAQRKGEGNITFEELRRSLIEEFRIPEERIAIATGAKNELDKVDVLARGCEIRFIITVDKLREGWDCPFAYVLCSVSNLTSRTAVEQIMGRVLRMPNAKRKRHEGLNYAYAFVTSAGFQEAAVALKDALVQSGFNPFEAQMSIVRGTQGRLQFGMPLFDTVTLAEVWAVRATADAVPESIRSNVRIEAASGPLSAPGTYVVEYSGAAICNEVESAWVEAAPTDAEKRLVRRLARKSRGESTCAADMGEPFNVPALAVRDGDQLSMFEEQFRENWRLSECDASLTEAEFSIKAGPSIGIEADIDEKSRKVSLRTFTDRLHGQLALLDVHGPRSEDELAVWLDRAFPHRDITWAECSLYMKKVVRELITGRGFALQELVANRFRLRDAVRGKIEVLRGEMARAEYQRMLLPECETPLEVSPEVCFSFEPEQYCPLKPYEGAMEFGKHYYHEKAHMNDEEVECAVIIDTLPEVEFWVRNPERRPLQAFWLQTPTDKFYPDFVAKLRDGRFLVVEYKGGITEDKMDTQEKDDIGRLWAARSNGLCVFCLVTRETMHRAIPDAASA